MSDPTKIPCCKRRFAILQRDNFTCKYCGRSPLKDGVKLEIDDINPKSNGGEYIPSNLITACKECNIGKSDVLLDKHNEQKMIKMAEESSREFYFKEKSGIPREKQGIPIKMNQLYLKYGEIPEEWIINNYTKIKKELGFGSSVGGINEATNRRLSPQEMNLLVWKCVKIYSKEQITEIQNIEEVQNKNWDLKNELNEMRLRINLMIFNHEFYEMETSFEIDRRLLGISKSLEYMYDELFETSKKVNHEGNNT